MKNINLLTNFNFIIGNGEFRKICITIKSLGFKRPVFLVDSGFSNSKLWKSLKKKINKYFGNNIIFLFPNNSEPTYDVLSKYLNIIKKKKLDLIIGVGGGSCMDTTKAIAGLLKNYGSPLNYRGFDKLKKNPLPCILVPSTIGTGSEVSHNASFVDTKKKIKMGINGRNMFPYKSIIDAEVTVSCPKSVLTSSVVDSLVHTLEAYVSKKSNLYTDMLCEKAFNLIIDSIDEVYSSKINLNKRLNLFYASFIAGIAQMNAGSGPAACISYPLSVYYRVPHGIGGGIFIIDIVKFNLKKGINKYLNLTNSNTKIKLKTKKKFIGFLENKFKKLGVPKNLKKFNIEKKDKVDLINRMQVMKKGFEQNPVKFTINQDFNKIIKNYL